MPRIPHIYAEFCRNRIKSVRGVYSVKNTEWIPELLTKQPLTFWDPKMSIFSNSLYLVL